MGNSTSATKSVASLRHPARIDISGFECVDENVHMIEWLGKGRDFRQFIASDIESELYAQDQGAQVLSVGCTSEPAYESKIKRQGDSSQGVLVQFSVTFPLVVCVKATGGVIWILGVQHNYHATDLDVPGQRKLKLNFTIVSQSQSDQSV